MTTPDPAACEMFDELVDLALSHTGLPGEADELQSKEISRSRARYALSAMLREGRNSDAALLAVKAGDRSSGHSRTIKVFRSHPDLTARFLDAGVIDALCSGRELATDWPGSNLHVEAALLSFVEQFHDMARSRIRSARNNFVAISRLHEEHGDGHNITAEEAADLAMAVTNVDGPSGALQFMRRWRPKDSFAVRPRSYVAAWPMPAGMTTSMASATQGGGTDQFLLQLRLRCSTTTSPHLNRSLGR